jgi:hypothetical protein
VCHVFLTGLFVRGSRLSAPAKDSEAKVSSLSLTATARTQHQTTTEPQNQAQQQAEEEEEDEMAALASRRAEKQNNTSSKPSTTVVSMRPQMKAAHDARQEQQKQVPGSQDPEPLFEIDEFDG